MSPDFLKMNHFIILSESGNKSNEAYKKIFWNLGTYNMIKISD